jgi:hypothetical protein
LPRIGDAVGLVRDKENCIRQVEVTKVEERRGKGRYWVVSLNYGDKYAYTKTVRYLGEECFTVSWKAGGKWATIESSGEKLKQELGREVRGR